MSTDIKVSLTIMGFIFMGTVLGGGLVKMFYPLLRYKYYYLTVFCGGLLAGLLAFELIPETIGSYERLGLLTGASGGIFIMILADKYIHQIKHSGLQNPQIILMLFIALLIHSVPTGIALGINLGEGEAALLPAVLVHHVPEGIVLMASLLISKANIHLFWLLCFLLSAAVTINLYLGLTVNFESHKIPTMFMGAAVGTLSYVTFYEILWKSFKKYSSFIMLFVILSGILSIRLFLYFV